MEYPKIIKCASCDKEFEQTLENKKTNGNYCPDCMKEINFRKQKNKWKLLPGLYERNNKRA